MPGTPGDSASPKSVSELVIEAREFFMHECGRAGAGYRLAHVAAFNDAIAELVAALEAVHGSLAEALGAEERAVAQWACLRTRVRSLERACDTTRGTVHPIVGLNLVALFNEARGDDSSPYMAKRKTFSPVDGADPVCVRCIALAAEISEAEVTAKLAADGDTCSRCGAVVVQQRAGESVDAWRARFRATTPATHAGASRDGSPKKG